MKNRTKVIGRRERTVSASQLKARCSAVLESVARSREPVVIVRRGRPVARLVPVDERRGSLFGLTRGCITIHEDIMAPIDVEWEAAR